MGENLKSSHRRGWSGWGGLALWLVLGLTAAARAGEASSRRPLVLLAVAGEIEAGSAAAVDQAQQAAARRHLETVLGRRLGEEFGLRLIDEETMREVRADAERWAVLTGGSMAEVREVLAVYQPDLFIRATFHTSPLTLLEIGDERTGRSRFWSCTAGLALEIAEAAGRETPVFRTTAPRAESVKRLRPLETALVALTEAVEETVEGLREDAIFAASALPPSKVGEPAVDLRDGNVIMYSVGDFSGLAELPEEARERIGQRLEAELARDLAAALGINTFDRETLARIRKNAEQWAVLQGGSVEQIAEALAPYALDACLRIRFHVPPPHLTRLGTGETIFGGTAVVTVELIDLKADRGVVTWLMESPPMGTNQDPAVRALSKFDATVGAISHCRTRIVESLVGRDPEAEPALTVAAAPSLPTVAVLWIKPDFRGWTVPRGRQQALTRRHQMQVNRFVREVKAEGSLGLQVSDYLIQGLADSGQLLPLDNTEAVRRDLGGVRNRLLELRMAGWVGERLPYDNPVEAVGEAMADYLATARIVRIEEPQPSGVAVFGANVATSEVRAWAEITIAEAGGAGRSWRFAGEGVASKTGWSTGISYSPGLQLDQTLFGNAVREALYNAAASVCLD